MINVKELLDPHEKSVVCGDILRALPNWFGNENSIVDYVKKVQSMPFFVASDDDMPVGFVSLKVHNLFTSEVCVMGVLKEYHRQGIGKMLIDSAVEYCMKNKTEFLTVKTLDESRKSKSYEKTRAFYLSVGFKPLEVFPLLWDKDNPCLFMAMHVETRHTAGQ